MAWASAKAVERMAAKDPLPGVVMVIVMGLQMDTATVKPMVQ